MVLSRLTYRSFIFLLLGVLYVGVFASYGKPLTGSITWLTGHYDAEGGGGKEDADFFAQKYNLMYNKDGTFLDGRGGYYRLGVGLEFFDFDTSINVDGVERKINKDSMKTLYNGQVVFAPGGLPVYVNVYARDNKSARFREDRSFSRGSFESDFISGKAGSSRILTPGIVDDISDGVRKEEGVSLMLGIKNGSYLGRYRNILSHLPKLYTDYRQTYVEDMESARPEKYIDRELAFVSLNKKHNWIHYRVYEHRDLLYDNEDYTRTSYMLGTVNHLMRREWINLTNWIQLSTDGTYFKSVADSSNQNNGERSYENAYQLNLFSKMFRNDWHATILPTFRREEEDGDLEKKFSIPVFVKAEMSRDTSWYLQMAESGDQEYKPFALVNQKSTEFESYAKLKFVLKRTMPIIFSPTMEVDNLNVSGGGALSGKAIRGFLELRSNKKHFPKKSFDIIFGGAYFTGESAINQDDGNYEEFSCDLDFSNIVSSNLRVGMDASLYYGSGNYDVGGDKVSPSPLVSVSNEGVGSVDISGVRATFFVEHNASRRMQNRFELSAEVIEGKPSSLSTTSFGLRHRLDYNGTHFELSSINNLGYGDSVEVNTLFKSSDDVQSLTYEELSGATYSTDNRLTYSPNRNWKSISELSANFVNPSSKFVAGGTSTRFFQNLEYSHFTRFGRKRKLYSLEGAVEYYNLERDHTVSSSYFSILGSASYYPTHWSRAGVRVQSKQVSEELDKESFGFAFYADLTFPALLVSAQYQLGMGDSDGKDDLNEHRWQLKVQKTF